MGETERRTGETLMSGVVYSPNPQSNREPMRSDNKWNPKELSPMMLRIMDLQLFNPRIKVKELAEVIGWSTGRIKRIISSDMYRQRYEERRLEIERLQHSKIARERARFEEIRNKMIDEHMKIIAMNTSIHGIKQLEAEKLRQKSISELLKVSEEHLKPASDNGGDNGDKSYEEHTRSVEIDTSDPNAAYMRIMEKWRKGTK